MRSVCAAVLLATALAGYALAQQQQQQYEGKPIRAIEFEPASPLDPADQAAALTLKIGEPLTRDALGKTIDKLFATGRFADIQADVEPRGDGVVVRFLIKPQYFIGHVGVRGKISAPPSDTALLNTPQLGLGTPFQDKDITAGESAITDLFKRNGLFEGTATHTLNPSANANQMMITFDVRSGRRARFTDPIITGDPKLSKHDIIKATHWQRFLIGGWKQITEARVRGGIDGLHKKYQKEDRLMAKVQLKSLVYDPATHRATPTLFLDAGPKVQIRALEAKVSKSRLKKYVPIFQEGTVDRDLIVEGARNLRNWFQSEGYYEAGIDFRQVTNAAKDEVTIEYIIARGERHKLVQVDITGNKYFSTEAIRERLILRPASFLQFRHGRYSEIYRKQDEDAITNLYKSNGFQDVNVTSTVVDDYKGKKGDVEVTYHIDEGAQWFVTNLNVNGMTTPETAEVKSRLSSQPGQPFSDFNVAADRKLILDYYFSNGYPNAEFRYSRAMAGPDRVNLTYEIKQGQQQFVRDVIVSGYRTTRPSVIDNNIKINAGEPLSPLAMTNAQHQLYELGIFARVDAAVQNTDGATAHKYIVYDLDEASRYTLNVGFGAEIARFGPTAQELSAPTGQTGFSPRVSIAVSRINFLGLGHTVSLQTRVSTLEQRGLFNYYAPRFRNVEGRNITFTALYAKSRDVLTFSSTREEASIQMSQILSKPSSILFRFAYRRVSASNIIIPTLLVPQLFQPVRIGIFSTNYIQDRRDDPVDPHHGIYNSVDLGLAWRGFGSQRGFLRELAQNATYTPLRGGKWTFAQRTTVGLIFPFSVPPGFSEASYVPLPERFFSGGADSNRGFPFNQAGPRDVGTPAGPGAVATPPTGFPLGGNAVVFHNTELRFPLIGENIGGVLFHDMGNVFDRIGDISFRASQRNLQDFNYMVHAVGFGIRYRTPVGPVRVDLAYSINPPSFIGFKGTTQQLIQCGPNADVTTHPFCTPVQQSVSHFQFFFSIGQSF